MGGKRDIMDIQWILTICRSIRHIFLYSDIHLVQSPEELSELLNKANPGANVKPSDVLAALSYGVLCEDRFDFDIQIKYRSPRSRKKPVASLHI